jgi:hypothetical protein
MLNNVGNKNGKHWECSLHAAERTAITAAARTAALAIELTIVHFSKNKDPPPTSPFAPEALYLVSHPVHSGIGLVAHLN